MHPDFFLGRNLDLDFRPTEIAMDDLVMAEKLDDVRFRLESFLRIAKMDFDVLGANPKGQRLLFPPFQATRLIWAQGKRRHKLPLLRENMEFPLAITTGKEIHLGGPDESGDEEIRGVVIDLARRPDLLDMAAIHDDDPIRHRHGFRLVMGDVNRNGPDPFVDLDDLGTHLDAEFGVEVRKRLVHEKDFRVTDDRAPEGNALALAARQGLGLAVEVFPDAENIRGCFHARIDLVFRDVAVLEAERHVVVDAHVGIEGVVLENHRDIAVLREGVVAIDPVDEELAVGDFLEPRDHAEGRRFAASGRTDEDDEFPVLDIEVEIENGLDVVVVNLIDVFQLNGWHVFHLIDIGRSV